MEEEEEEDEGFERFLKIGMGDTGNGFISKREFKRCIKLEPLD